MYKKKVLQDLGPNRHTAAPIRKKGFESPPPKAPPPKKPRYGEGGRGAGFFLPTGGGAGGDLGHPPRISKTFPEEKMKF